MKRWIVMTLMAAEALVVGASTFFEVAFETLMCNVLRVEANGVAALATCFTVIGFALGAVLAYQYGCSKPIKERIKERLFVIVSFIFLGALYRTITFFSVRCSILMCTGKYVQANRVAAMATFFEVMGFMLGAASIFMDWDHVKSKKD